jgi:hypothetical protein
MQQPKTFFASRTAAIIFTGCVAGTLDIIAACLQFYLKTGRGPGPVLRYIASGVFGKKAFAGATTGMAAWGLLFHFVIAIGLAAFYFFLYPRIPGLRKHRFLAGVGYGLFAWVITTQVIVPLSRAIPGPFHWQQALVAAAILVACIGLPISLLANKYYLYKK